jgi:hypothetical protein
MKYTIDMGSDAMIHIPSLIRICSVIKTLMRGYTGTHTAWGLHKPTFIVSK